LHSQDKTDMKILQFQILLRNSLMSIIALSKNLLKQELFSACSIFWSNFSLSMLKF
jgi:hypothetical protein